MILVVTIKEAKNIFSVLIATDHHLFLKSTFKVRTARAVYIPPRLTWADKVEIRAWSPRIVFSNLELAAPMMTDHGNDLAAHDW